MMEFKFTILESQQIVLSLELRQKMLLEFIKKFEEDTILKKMYINEISTINKLIEKFENYKF
jgi:division protein CdvB (Snf7/Vps24/ESCRT-III family)